MGVCTPTKIEILSYIDLKFLICFLTPIIFLDFDQTCMVDCPSEKTYGKNYQKNWTHQLFGLYEFKNLSNVKSMGDIIRHISKTFREGGSKFSGNIPGHRAYLPCKFEFFATIVNCCNV